MERAEELRGDVQPDDEDVKREGKDVDEVDLKHKEVEKIETKQKTGKVRVPEIKEEVQGVDSGIREEEDVSSPECQTRVG